MSENLKYNNDPTHTDYLLSVQKLNLEAGTLGKFFGSQPSAASSIAWVVVFLLVVSGILTLFFNCTISFTDYWKTVGPFITLLLGFLFGRKSE